MLKITTKKAELPNGFAELVRYFIEAEISLIISAHTATAYVYITYFLVLIFIYQSRETIPLCTYTLARGN
jgi:hypothetical protein